MSEGATRLIVRIRADFKPSVTMTVLGAVFYGFLDFVMSRKMFIGIKHRAEQRAVRRGSATHHGEPVGNTDP